MATDKKELASTKDLVLPEYIIPQHEVLTIKGVEYSAANFLVKTEDLVPYANNSRTHSAKQVKQLESSMVEWGFTNPVIIDENFLIIAGHGRILAANNLNMPEVPCRLVKGWSDAKKKAYCIADNKLALNAGWNTAMLELELEELEGMEFDIQLLGFDDDELIDLFDTTGEKYAEGIKNSMSANYGVPPFSVFNAREGGWQKRKKYWIEGHRINSFEGRDIDNTNATPDINRGNDQGGSIFDPVLCEIGYSWFCPDGGLILDPFSGGSVRGVMAALTGYDYFGIDLRPEQITANEKQGEKVLKDVTRKPTWVCGDSQNLDAIAANVEADLLFSCPPYADLEVYSNDENDLSNMPYEQFMAAYSKIIALSYDKLKDNSFAVWVVGEVRGKDGNYYNFVGDTIKAFTDAGFAYYNEAILVTPVGSLPLRAGKTMKSSRKLGKSHQNVLIFVKGNGKAAAQRCGDINIVEMKIEDES